MDDHSIAHSSTNNVRTKEFIF